MNRVKWTALAVVALAAAAGSGIVAAQAGGQAADAPQEEGTAAAADSRQPIAFPHDKHAGDLQMPCMYCHYSADVSVDAGIPSVAVCAGCHAPAGAPFFLAESEEIQKLVQYWNEKKPIPWVRIYDIPDHARFPHFMHINAEIECQECHGPVEEMAEIEQYPSLQMGWCVDCHRERGARTDCTVCHY